MKMFSQHMTKMSSRSRRSVHSCEALEPRCMLDGLGLIDDQFAARQNSGAIVLQVMENDIFPDNYDGAREITAASYGSQGGTISISDDAKSILYRPPVDFHGTEKFSYFVDNQAFANVEIGIETPLNNDEYTFPPDGVTRSLDVMANDPFWKDYVGNRQISLVSTTANGSNVRISDDGKSVLYTPSREGPTLDKFDYIVDGLYSATVNIDFPITLVSDEYEIIQNTKNHQFRVLSNDPFWPTYDLPKLITAVSEPQLGTLVVAEDGKSVIYTPDENASGWDSFSYVVDGQYESYASVIVHRPVRDDYFEIDYNSTNQSFDVIDNDYYYSRFGDRRDIINRVTSVDESAAGATVAISNDGQSIVYSAIEGFSGQDTVTYVADNNHPATVTISVTRPVRDDYYFDTVFQDTPNAFLNVLENDFKGNGYKGAKQITSITDPEQGGLLELRGNSLFYTPPEMFVGSESFAYTVDNELEANVVFQVQALAQNDSQYLCVNSLSSPMTYHVLRNDNFDHGYSDTAPAIITSVNDIATGGVTINPGGQSLTVELTSQPSQQFEYTVDGKYSATAYISIQGHLNGDSMVVDQNSDSQTFDVLQNDFYQWANPRPQDCAANYYRGDRRITGVTQTEMGGIATVTDDGASVGYEPPADFLGTDSFQYEVDGVMQQTVFVNVIRRVRDDRFRVDPGAENEQLPVLVNDLFGADYRGAGVVTDVTMSTAGAALSVADNGRSIVYSAPVGFTGDDTFTYTVDGRQLAEVTVSVRNEDAIPFDRFETLGEFEQFLVDDAAVRYQGLFGQTYYPFWERDFFEDAALDGVAPRDHSETNVQVEGIDEGDIVEFDSDYIYTLSGRELVITDAWPGNEAHVASRTLISGNPEAEFLNGDRLTVISSIVEQVEPEGDQPEEPNPVVDRGVGDVIDFFIPRIPVEFNYYTVVTVFDVNDRTNPTQVQKTTMEGQFVESRAVGDYVYAVVNNEAVAPKPELVEFDLEDGTTTNRYETEEEYFTRIAANTATLFEAALPNYTSEGADGELARTGLLNQVEEIYKPLSDGASNLLSVVSVNINNDEPGLSNSAAVYTKGGSIVYASLQNFYVFDAGYRDEDGPTTSIHKFDWQPEDGGIQFVAASFVPGSMINQFSADEYNGHLRIATNIRNAGSGNWSNRPENALFVVQDDGGTIEYVGKLDNLGLDESLRSVRFMGDRAFAVTFRDIDPLFGLDLSDPTSPRSVGAIPLPGYLEYMQLITPDRLLAVGVNSPSGISNGPTQVSLFDVSDLAAPRLIDGYTFERYSTSEAGVDHHAFGYYATHGLFALPSTRSYYERVDLNNDGFKESSKLINEYELVVFRVDTTVSGRNDAGLELVGKIEHESPVRRSGYIGDQLYSVADDSLKVVSVSDPQTVIAVVEDLTQVEIEQPEIFWPVWPFPFFDAAVDAAAADLAARLNISPGQAVPVAAEPGNDGVEIIFRVGEQHFLYHAAEDEVILKDDTFAFSEHVTLQNPNNPLDINGDNEVSPNDALLLIMKLNDGDVDLSTGTVLRQIQNGETNRYFFDANGDGKLSAHDVALIINELNANSVIITNPNELKPDEDPEVIDRVFDQVRGLVGDSNLDGRFDSADLVLIFSSGEYEDDIEDNSTWSRGDWDGDRDFTTRDLIFAFQHNNYIAAAIADLGDDR